MQRTHPYLKPDSAWTLGADGDGGFAQYVAVRSEEAHSIKSSYSDARASIISLCPTRLLKTYFIMLR